MNRMIGLALLLAVALPSAASAGMHLGVGAAVDGFFPYDPEMYGSRMIGNAWGKDMLGKNWSVGADRAQYFSINRPSMIYSPELTETFFWDFGLGIDLSEQIQYMFFEPNKEVDVSFERFVVPIRLTLKYTFLRDGKVRPFVGAGASINYTITRMAGKDFYDKWPNPDYESDVGDEESQSRDEQEGKRSSSPDEADEFLTRQIEWGVSGWYPGFHGAAGVQFGLPGDLSLTVGLRYEVLLIESLDAELVMDGPETWHWKRNKLKGDAGGFGASVGILASF